MFEFVGRSRGELYMTEALVVVSATVASYSRTLTAFSRHVGLLSLASLTQAQAPFFASSFLFLLLSLLLYLTPSLALPMMSLPAYV